MQLYRDNHFQNNIIACVSTLILLVLAGCGAAGAAEPTTDVLLETEVATAETLTTETPATGETPAQQPNQDVYQPTLDVDTVMSSPDYGIQVFLYWQEEIADRDLKLVQDAGFRWVKQEIPWREVEGHGKGVWQWDSADRIMDQVDAHNLKMIARLGSQPEWASSGVEYPEVGPPDDMQDFYDYVYAVADRYKGRIEAYQIWNEPNLAREWGARPPNPAEYTEMLKTAYAAVKAADPNAIVISAGMAPTTRNDAEAMPDSYFIQGMYDAGASPYFDVLGVHAPGFKSEPEIDPAIVAADPGLSNNDSAPEELRRVYAFRRVEDLREIMVKNGDEAKKVVVLEFGWTIDPRPDSPYRWHAVTDHEQDKYLQRAFAYAQENWQPWIGVMSVIYIANPQWTYDDEQLYWSVVYPGFPELRTSKAYYGLDFMPKVPPAEGVGQTTNDE